MSSFSVFWVTYPRKVGKTAAEKAWDKAVKDGAAPEDIIEGARKYDLDPGRRSKDIGYTAHPATWLNAGRWMDDLAVTNAPEPVDLARRWDNDTDPEYPTAMTLFPHIRKPEGGYTEPHKCKVITRKPDRIQT